MALKQITIRVSEDASNVFDAVSTRSGVSRARLLAEAIEMYAGLLQRGMRVIPDASLLAAMQPSAPKR
jgi:hypothetical protein